MRFPAVNPVSSHGIQMLEPLLASWALSRAVYGRIFVHPKNVHLQMRLGLEPQRTVLTIQLERQLAVVGVAPERSQIRVGLGTVRAAKFCKKKTKVN